jgi:beta-glucosidase
VWWRKRKSHSPFIFSRSFTLALGAKSSMRKVSLLFFGLCAAMLLCGQESAVSARVDSLLALMTLEEKVGQLHQISNPFSATGPIKPAGDYQQQIKAGKIGSMLNIVGVARTRQLQELAMKSRLKIPLLFAQDVIHGFRTTFPLPLAEAASWDLDAMERSARMAAIEASAAGIHWVFAPMIDVSRDPRWGRVMEGAGEDTYLGSLIAAARVKGFQGAGLGTPGSVMACAKHFAAYGAAIAGRDYNSVDMSERQLRETYLPPFKAAAKAGVATFMNSFNDINGIPATASALLQRKILKGEWNFDGFVVSDWGSMGEMMAHGYAADLKDAALKSIVAGSDMDMESRAFTAHLASLVKTGTVSQTIVDEAVRRVLTKKFEMGLFDDPFKYCNLAEETTQRNNPAHLAESRSLAAKSIVLLKNNAPAASPSAILPLSTTGRKIALIGPLAKAKSENLGFWSIDWPDDSARIVSVHEGIKGALGSAAQLLYAKGCNLNDDDSSGFAEAVRVAAQADAIVLTLGELRDMSGEAKSRSRLNLPGVQQQLLARLAATGKPIVLLISAGRPLVLADIEAHAHAILYTWWLGTEAGNAIADVLFGKVNPQGRLPITFPRSEGQIPIYYNHLNTGRPAKSDTDHNYVSAYLDLPNSPQYAFGYGLGYGNVLYSRPTVSTAKPKAADTLVLKVTLTYTGTLPRTETVQLYIRDWVASVAQPVKALKAFQQITLQPGERRQVVFKLALNELGFYNADLQYVAEPGAFDIMVGPSSDNVQTLTVNWRN